LIVFFGGGTFLDWFPISGVVSDNFESLSPMAKAIDFLHHLVLPLICYMASEFAVLTMMMKNTLLDELNKDYIRTALVKGLTFSRAVWRHALRNSLIPLATGAGEILTVMFAGSLLIERVFDIDGMGLLFYTSITDRDYNVVLGLIVLTSVLTVLGASWRTSFTWSSIPASDCTDVFRTHEETIPEVSLDPACLVVPADSYRHVRSLAV
jgi:microcin C transport system permease protein